MMDRRPARVDASVKVARRGHCLSAWFARAAAAGQGYGLVRMTGNADG